jgi:pentatricopeptide repeat protein
VHAGRDEARLGMDYHRVLVYCATRGDWRGALRVYRTLSDRRLPPTYPTTFQTVLLAAKNAKPRAASALVVPVMEEVEACGFAPTRELYHSAMDVCRAAGHWRQALALFSRMTAGGVNPTTHTYALLEQAGALARATEPVEVYSAMTYSGGCGSSWPSSCLCWRFIRKAHSALRGGFDAQACRPIWPTRRRRPGSSTARARTRGPSQTGWARACCPAPARTAPGSGGPCSPRASQPRAAGADEGAAPRRSARRPTLRRGPRR